MYLQCIWRKTWVNVYFSNISQLIKLAVIHYWSIYEEGKKRCKWPLKCFIFYLCNCACVCVCMPLVCRCLWWLQEIIGLCGMGVTGGCEPPSMSAGNWTRVLWKISKYPNYWIMSQAPGYLFLIWKLITHLHKPHLVAQASGIRSCPGQEVHPAVVLKVWELIPTHLKKHGFPYLLW